MTDPLRACREAFGTPPPEFSFWDRLTYLRVRPPEWLRKRPQDLFRFHFQNVAKALAEGTAVWNHVIQANKLIYKPGTFDLGGELVYSLNDAHRAYRRREVSVFNSDGEAIWSAPWQVVT